jgi:hypothetical protein
MKTILLPVDFSAASQNAAQNADPEMIDGE